MLRALDNWKALSNRARIQLQVASEFGYSHDIVTELLQRNRYENAGELIEDLEKSDLQVEDIEKEKVDAATVTGNFEQKLTVREETERLFHASICLVCHVSKRTRVCLPCCHLTHCEKCETAVKHCPQLDCKENVECTIRTFF